MPKSGFGFAALCDAVYRDEQSNKAILAGVYSGDVNVESLPFELRFGLYIEVTSPADGDHEIDLQFYINGKQIGGAKAGILATVKGKNAALLVPTFGILISDPASLEIKGVFEGGRAVSLLKKRIDVRPSEPSD